jgi:hypothetical protein
MYPSLRLWAMDGTVLSGYIAVHGGAMIALFAI